MVKRVCEECAREWYTSIAGEEMTCPECGGRLIDPHDGDDGGAERELEDGA